MIYLSDIDYYTLLINKNAILAPYQEYLHSLHVKRFIPFPYNHFRTVLITTIRKQGLSTPPLLK